MFPIPPTIADAILDLNGFHTLYSVFVSFALSYRKNIPYKLPALNSDDNVNTGSLKKRGESCGFEKLSMATYLV